MAEAQKDKNEDPKEAFERLTGTQKSAILMMLIGEEEAAEILKNLSPREVQHLGAAMYSVQGLGQDLVNQVLDEFLTIIKEQTSLGLGAGNYIRNVLTKALGDDKAQSVLTRITPTSQERPIEILDWMDARSIAELVVDEQGAVFANGGTDVSAGPIQNEDMITEALPGDLYVGKRIRGGRQGG